LSPDDPFAAEIKRALAVYPPKGTATYRTPKQKPKHKKHIKKDNKSHHFLTHDARGANTSFTVVPQLK
jgi:hypothetical protein